jgi:hypothetical protein
MQNEATIKNEPDRKFSYPPKTFRLAPDTVKAIISIKKKTNKSYNLLFLDLVNTWQKYKKPKITDNKN